MSNKKKRIELTIRHEWTRKPQTQIIPNKKRIIPRNRKHKKPLNERLFNFYDRC